MSVRKSGGTRGYSPEPERAMESKQAGLKTKIKVKAKPEQVKKLEPEITEFEVILDRANRSKAKQKKNMKRMQQQLREMQDHLRDEQRQRGDVREQLQ